MTQAIATIRTVTELDRYLEACERKRAQLIASEKARLRATRLLDSDYDRIAGWMANWRKRYIARTVHGCTEALCPLHADPRDTSIDVSRDVWGGE